MPQGVLAVAEENSHQNTDSSLGWYHPPAAGGEVAAFHGCLSLLSCAVARTVALPLAVG